MQKLTKREMQIVNLLVEGLTNKQIADRLFLSVHTIKANLENIYEKLNVHSRVELAVYVIKNEYINSN